MAVLGLCCSAWAFSAYSERVYSVLWCRASHCSGFSLASLAAEDGLGSQLQQLQHAGSVVAVHRFSCSVAHKDLSRPGLNPQLLHWQVDS